MFLKKILNDLNFVEKGLKVCLNDKIVKHKFLYAEEWVQSDIIDSDDSKQQKYLRKCFFAKFVINFLKFVQNK